MARLDGVWSDAQGLCFGIASGNRNSQWVVMPQWHGQLRIYRHQGLLVDLPVSAGATFAFSDGGNSTPAILSLTRR